MTLRVLSPRARSGAGWLALFGVVCFGFVPVASARITQINITTVESPTFSGASFGAVGAYERIDGTMTGEVDPKDPLNADIVDIGLATKSADGKVGYSADFQILRPVDLANGNHRVIFDLPNRGRATALTTFNDSTSGNNTTTAGSPGNGFLMNGGYTIVEGAWDITAAQGGASFGVTFPIAKNKNGSTITGRATEEFVIDKNATPASEPLTYPAVSADKSQAFLTVRENYGDKPQLVPASGWDYTDSTLTAVKLTSGNFGGPGSFGPTALYEFTYTAKNPLVAGLGFAALRDFATFLRAAKTDDKGVANPLAGNVQRIYTSCVSQPCRTTRDFLLFGFNEAEKTHAKVFDAMLNWIGGGDGIFMNYRFAQPTRTQRQHIARWTPEFQFPFADVAIFDRATGKYGSRLDACRRSSTCPKIFEVNSENEYWSKGGSMLTTDGQGHDLELSSTPGVRYYQLSSLPHGAGTAAGICQQPQNPLGPDQVLRALLVDLDQWVSSGRQPPANRVPSFASHTLAPSLPQSGMGFPHIPGVTYNGILHTGDLWNFGPKFDEGILTVLPPQLLGTPYKIFVPKTDADGNDIAGIRTPDVAVPVATYTGWGLRASAPGDPVPIVDGCDASGQKLLFEETKAERLAAGDPRLSLQERYKDHATYVSLVTAAAQSLESQRLLLGQDVQNYIAAAQAAAVP
ncbi:MAG TPA: alpha/beta hydrolase domain-containing protein [Stellaceae bacterium]